MSIYTAWRRAIDLFTKVPQEKSIFLVLASGSFQHQTTAKPWHRAGCVISQTDPWILNGHHEVPTFQLMCHSDKQLAWVTLSTALTRTVKQSWLIGNIFQSSKPATRADIIWGLQNASRIIFLDKIFWGQINQDWCSDCITNCNRRPSCSLRKWR